MDAVKDAPHATFQKMVTKVKDLIATDVRFTTRTFKDHLEILNKVLTRFKENNLKLSPEKCFFIQEKVKFLGHVVSEQGIQTDPEKIDKVKNWPTPKKADELRSFLAFCGYSRRFIRYFSKLIRPLTEILPSTSSKTSKKVFKDWQRTEKEEHIFNQLKETLVAPPIQAFPDFSLPFELHTDASTKTICNNMNFIPYIETLPTAYINILEVTEDFGTPMAQIKMRK
ncbi:uncharacterized protein LOC132736753 [Ruditapes philippinarum]|uniref:uncharacterized protein LOC132736753 n=1 Tax=Ruditapes philippinarum TaxID=129788 RepID=UPI00295B4C65|nr:uncharacterized protein LOC132736753 [Ruditapes philippinarum]